MNSAESFSDNKQEKSISEAEQTEIDFYKNWYKNAKQKQPDISEDDVHKTIISGLGYHLGIPGYGLGEQDNPDIKPTEEQQARLEELYEMVIDEEETTGWENMAEEVEKLKEQEKSISKNEQTEIDFYKNWYKNAKQKQPDISEDDVHKTIISGLGYHLGIPGYGLGEQDNPDIKPTEEQQARLEELYEMVIEKN